MELNYVDWPVNTQVHDLNNVYKCSSVDCFRHDDDSRLADVYRLFEDSSGEEASITGEELPHFALASGRASRGCSFSRNSWLGLAELTHFGKETKKNAPCDAEDISSSVHTGTSVMTRHLRIAWIRVEGCHHLISARGAPHPQWQRVGSGARNTTRRFPAGMVRVREIERRAYPDGLGGM